MARTLALASLCIATALLAGCVSYGGGYSNPPPPQWYWGGPEWGASLAAVMVMVMVLLAIVAAAVVALALLAMTARGPVAQVAGAFLLVLGAWVLLASFPQASLFGVAVGMGMAALGVAALAPQPAPPPATRSVITEERR